MPLPVDPAYTATPRSSPKSPFDADGYDWAHTYRLVAEAEELVETAACRALDLSHRAENDVAAISAVRQGMRAVPLSPRLTEALTRTPSGQTGRAP